MPPIAYCRPPTADGRQSNRHNGILQMLIVIADRRSPSDERKRSAEAAVAHKSAEPLWFKGVIEVFVRKERGMKFFRLGPPLPPTEKKLRKFFS